MSYVDGYVLAISKKHLTAYRRMAALGRKAWMKHGAVDYKECAGDDLAAKWGTPFTRVMKLRPGETAVFAASADTRQVVTRHPPRGEGRHVPPGTQDVARDDCDHIMLDL
jgi:uncharacterized protein YbaA (DUF1428 family)